ncbi:MmyB family transcriptional regulator [Streptomyces sp. O3]
MNDAVAGRGSACDGPGSTADPATRSYLRDYAAMLYATPFPSLLVNHRWDVVVANSAYDALFHSVRPHPTAMPRHNFLRFVLFHPDAADVLAEHETSWCLPMLAQFASAVETHPQDQGIQDIRLDIAADPLMNAAYQQGLPHWIRAVGSAAVDHDGAVRPLRHPDPAQGRSTCRIISETPATLRAIGFSRLTLVLQDPGLTATPRPRRGAPHLRVV